MSIFEIPASDIARATEFYQKILNVKIERIDFPEMKMGVFPYQGPISYRNDYRRRGLQAFC